MKCVDRKGYEISHNGTQDKILAFLYQTNAGRILLSHLVKPWVSRFAGALLNHSFSRFLIKPFVKKNKIDLSIYEDQVYVSYNDFFTRKIKKDYRELDSHPNHLVAPCDGKLSVYQINKDAQFLIKNTLYSMKSFTRNNKLAAQYEGGTLLLFRLTVDDYHRYCYIDSGTKTNNIHIPGIFHTVNPISCFTVPVYKENTREYSLLRSENFGNILMCEVGALLVGKIVNYHEKANVRRGEDKGMFEFGGSTIIICLEKDKASIDQDILENSINGVETAVKMGTKIGVSIIENN